MVDFLMISSRSTKSGIIEVRPRFIVQKTNDLMIRGSDFYAIWVEEKQLWSTDMYEAIRIIDAELDKFVQENQSKYDLPLKPLYLWDTENGMVSKWLNYCKKCMPDNYHNLDEKLIFANTPYCKEDYASKRLPYPLEKGPIEAYDKLISTLYSSEEREKLEWAIGSIVHGDSKFLQKFVVLYGSAGTGKSTILNIIQDLFQGYWAVFDAKALGSANSTFALEAFKSNPLVAIQHDGDLSRIEDNTRLNSLVSHETMTVNEKFKATYSTHFNSFLFMGTNKPVRITDAKSGLIRRLIDISPSGNTLPKREYNSLVGKIRFELGAIAEHCLQVYVSDPGKYDSYVPLNMLGASNDFYNFVMESYDIFKRDNEVSLKVAWEMYKTYCEDAKVFYPYSRKNFQEELKNYFEQYEDRHTMADGIRVRSYYIGFLHDKFEEKKPEGKKPKQRGFLDFIDQPSFFDDIAKKCPAQYAKKLDESPRESWANVNTTLSDLDTTKLHYVLLDENHIIIDFDIKDENGKKSFEKNKEAASKFPPTYGELSKSGEGIHLHYIYDGDTSLLSKTYNGIDDIEIKVYRGNAALRRKLTKCNDFPIAKISSGLPTKGEPSSKMVSQKQIKNNANLHKQIVRILSKEFGSTIVSCNFLDKVVRDAYDSGIEYDIRDLRYDIEAFAANSTNNSAKCLQIVKDLPYTSKNFTEILPKGSEEFVFFDCEVYPNLFVTVAKVMDKPVFLKYVNPKPSEVAALFDFNLIGFNCRKYDNHILWAASIGYNNEQLYNLSQRIILGGTDFDQDVADENDTRFFQAAYNISYTDILEFSSKKQSLKKFEIELGIHHKEMEIPWDKPVPEELIEEVVEYCTNDVIATEAVFKAREADFTAHKILADIAGKSVNSSGNALTAQIIFGNNKNPQAQFNYRNMGDTSKIVHRVSTLSDRWSIDGTYTCFDENWRPIFPGYVYEKGVSKYRGEVVGEGGEVYAEPNQYAHIALLDIASMHPSSAIAENIFGDMYTPVFQSLKQARIYIKHKEFDKAKQMFNGALAKYLTDESMADNLAYALKIAINKVYGLTSAKFVNRFKDPRNVDNIVAKRGALFMINLRHEVQARGFTVAHIKTDSIKIPNATPEIIQFVKDYGKLYGYDFEHEATYDRMCLVNDAVYIAKYATVEQCEELYGKEYVQSEKDIVKDCKKHGGEWTATGTQFQVPYVFKTLFTHEDIDISDLCETKSVKSAMYLDRVERAHIDVSAEEKEYKTLLAKYKKEKLPSQEDRLKELAERIAQGHDYVFVGKVGQFCPIKPGFDGAVLVRENSAGTTPYDLKYASVTGTKGFLWKESEDIKKLNMIDIIDRSYYDKLADAAKETISKYGDFDKFVSGEVDIPQIKDDDTPPWALPCGRCDINSCAECQHYTSTLYDYDCSEGFDISNVMLKDGNRLEHPSEKIF